MIRSLEHPLVVLLLIMLSITSVNPAFAKDIRARVINETDLDERVVLFCLQYCQGNERKGYLRSVTVNQKGDGHYLVAGKAYLQNRHVVRDPFEFVLYDHTVIIATFGTLNPDNCELRVDNVLIENDFYNVFNSILRDQGDIIGRVEKVPDCRRFLE